VDDGLNQVVPEKTGPAGNEQPPAGEFGELARQLSTEVGQILVDHIPTRRDEMVHSRSGQEKQDGSHPAPSVRQAIKPFKSMS
jgi:hypothetical protein